MIEKLCNKLVAQAFKRKGAIASSPGFRDGERAYCASPQGEKFNLQITAGFLKAQCFAPRFMAFVFRQNISDFQKTKAGRAIAKPGCF